MWPISANDSNASAAPTHVTDSARRTLRIDAGNRIVQQRDAQAGGQRIEDGMLDAIVGRETANVQARNPTLSQIDQKRLAVGRVAFKG